MRTIESLLGELTPLWSDVCAKSPLLTRKRANRYMHAVLVYAWGTQPEPPSSLIGEHGAIGSISDPVAWKAYDAAAKALLEQVEFNNEPANLHVYPGKLVKQTGAASNAADPIGAGWLAAKAGQLVRVHQGVYLKTELKLAARPNGSMPVLIWGSAPETAAEFGANPVGGSNCLYLTDPISDCEIRGFEFQADDTACIINEPHEQLENFALLDCYLHGQGDAEDPNWSSFPPAKWGLLLYQTKNLRVENCVVHSIQKEHFAYIHGPVGNHVFRNIDAWHLGRTFLQMLSRKFDVTTPGSGDILVDRCTIEDVCIESGGGGSAFSFRGGMPDCKVTIRDTIVRMGCNPWLSKPWRNITGALVMDEEPNSNGPGLSVWPGGTGELHLDGVDIEVGTIYPGDRDVARVSVCGLFAMERPCRIVASASNQGMALSVGGNVQAFKVTAPSQHQVIGKVSYHGTVYQNWANFIAAHPEVAA